MLYALAHWLRDHCPWIWETVEYLNSWVFALRYGRRLKGLDTVLARHQGAFAVELLKAEDVPELVKFFCAQPEEAFTFFHPHGFDEKTLHRLQRSRSFLTFVVKEKDVIVGYFFLRCFLNGKAFRGKIVDYRWRNQGIAKLMGIVATDVAFALKMRLFTTISPDNYSSLASAKAANDIRIVQTLENGYYYIECTPKKANNE